MTPVRRDAEAEKVLQDIIATASSISREAERLVSDHARVEESNKRLRELVAQLEAMSDG